MSFVKKVKSLGLPLDKIIVIGSGVLDAYGIRDASDIDLAVAPEIFGGLEQDREWVKRVASWGETYFVKDNCEVWRGWTEDGADYPMYDDLMKDTVEIDGIRFMSLDFVRRWKQAKGREKDLRDVTLIDAHNIQET